MKLKIIAYLSVLTLLLTLAPISVPVNAQPPTITFLMHYNSQEDVWYWGNITEAYYNETGVHVEVQAVNFSIFRSTIFSRHAIGDDPDMMFIHCMWLPEFCTIDNGIGMLATPPDDVIANIIANWTDSSIEAATFLNQTWGYPTEYNAYALVYNKDVLNQSGYSEGTGPGQYPPKNWTELLEMGTATTQRDNAGIINLTGFQPIISPISPTIYEEERYQFLSLLWSNGGEFIQLPPEEKAVRFNETEGHEVLQKLYIDTINVTYDPAHIFDTLSAGAWVWPWKLNFAVLPNWMGNIIKSGMGAKFTSDYVGIAPIPLGSNGTAPVSLSYNWMAVTTKKAEERGKAGLCWDFYRWLFSPESGKTTSRMGEFLIGYSVIPSRIADQADPRLQSDFWFRTFIDIGAAYGRPDLYFKTGDAVQVCMGEMLEAVTVGGKSIDDPENGLQATATKVYNLLPVEEPAFMATLLSPANLYVTDPENRHVGTDPTTGQLVNEIPDAFYTGPGSEPQQIIIPHPLDGVYDIAIIGTGTGTYTLVVELATLSNATTEIYTGTIVTGEILRSEATVSEGKITATQPSPHDIAVTNVTTSKTVVGQGYNVSINVTVENQGNYTETFNVTCYANTVVIATITNITLTSGNSTTLTFTWNTTGFDKGNYTISAYASPVEGETATNDNLYVDGTVKIDITSPTIVMLSPQNKTYYLNSIPLTFELNEPASWIAYSLDNQSNVTLTGNTTLTGLALGQHNVIVYANDTYGNMGSSDRIYFTRTYGCVTVRVQYKDGYPRSGAIVWIYSPINREIGTTGEDGKVTNCGLGLSQGSYWIRAYWPDSGTQFGPNAELYVNSNGDGSSTITKNSEITPPSIDILSPQNTTYTSSSVPLNFTIYDYSSISWIGYSLDNQANVTITGNTTLSSLSYGRHNVVVYANDTFGNMGASNKIFFSVAIIVPDHYPTIQEAINNANEGDTIFVRAGTYVHENIPGTTILVNKTVQLVGENKWTTIVSAKGYGTVFTIAHDYVNITGFTIEAGGHEPSDPGSGVYLDSVHHCNISGNRFRLNVDGVWLASSTDITVSGNEIFGSTQNGIKLSDSSHNNIYNNNITSNGQKGFFIDSSSDNKFYHNNVIDNTDQVFSTGSTNAWDCGYPSGGNYWSDYNGTDLYLGPYQNETGSDGIGDTPYIIDANNTDHYPLMNPYGSPPPLTYALTITTTAGGTTNPAPETYSYTANSKVPVTAITDTYYTLDHWELDGNNVGSANPINVTMDIDHTLYAVFMLHDVAITSVAPFKTVVGQGYSTSINITVANQGNYTETFNITVYANTTIIETKTNITLTSRNSTTLTFTWNTTGFDKGNYTISAYAWPVQGETDLTYNTYNDGIVTIAMVGDVNADGVIDIFDIAYVAVSFGSEYGKLSPPGTQPYKPNADIIEDKIIDIFDIAAVAIHFGETDS